MTKEELKKEAIKYAVDYPTSYGKGYKHKDLRIAYLAGAEPREKQIQIDAEQIRALQKQNGELTDELAKKADTNHQLVEQMAKLSEENAELKTKKIPQLERRIASIRGSHRVDVKKLNARIEQVERLKKELEEADNATDCFNRQEEIIAKAKQFIRDFLSVAVDYICPIDKNYSLIAEAEQFLKENA